MRHRNWLLGLLFLLPTDAALAQGDTPASSTATVIRAGVLIDGVSMTYYEDRNPEKSRGIVQLEGLALDGRRRIIDAIRAATRELVQVEEDQNDAPAGTTVRISSPGLPFALGLFDDRRAFLARSMPSDSKAAQHLQVLNLIVGEGRSPNLLSGYHPPWLRTALGEVPADACGLFLGEIPAHWRKRLTEGLGLRACPRTFVFYLRREGPGVALSLRLNLDKAGEELMLLEDLDKWRREGLDVLQVRYPAIRKEPVALALLGHSLKTMRWGANPGSGCVRTQVRIPGPTWRALGKLLKQAAQPDE